MATSPHSVGMPEKVRSGGMPALRHLYDHMPGAALLEVVPRGTKIKKPKQAGRHQQGKGDHPEAWENLERICAGIFHLPGNRIVLPRLRMGCYSRKEADHHRAGYLDFHHCCFDFMRRENRSFVDATFEFNSFYPGIQKSAGFFD